MFFKGLVLIALAAILQEQTATATTVGATDSQITGALMVGWVGLLAVGVLYLIVGVLQLLSQSQTVRHEDSALPPQR